MLLCCLRESCRFRCSLYPSQGACTSPARVALAAACSTPTTRSPNLPLMHTHTHAHIHAFPGRSIRAAGHHPAAGQPDVDGRGRPAADPERRCRPDQVLPAAGRNLQRCVSLRFAVHSHVLWVVLMMCADGYNCITFLLKSYRSPCSHAYSPHIHPSPLNLSDAVSLALLLAVLWVMVQGFSSVFTL